MHNDVTGRKKRETRKTGFERVAESFLTVLDGFDDGERAFDGILILRFDFLRPRQDRALHPGHKIRISAMRRIQERSK